MNITTYEHFNDNKTVEYGAPATSAGVNKGPLFLKKELNNLYNYSMIKFGESPLEWNSKHIYEVGEYCMHNGVIYKALNANSDSEPNNDNWEAVDVLKDYVNTLAWNSSTTYRTGDIVTYNGNIYEAIQDNTNQLPTNTAYWKNVSKIGQTSINISGNFVRTDGDSAPISDNTYSIGTLTSRFANIFSVNLHGTIDCGTY